MKNKSYRCFSLIEVVMAVFLITTGLLAAESLIVGSLKESTDSRDQIIAGLLAQEGAELARNIRDNSWTSPPGKSFHGFPANGENNCIIDIDSGDTDVRRSDCEKSFAEERLYIDSNNRYRSYDFRGAGGTPTKFSRKIDIAYDQNNPGNIAKTATITSMVTWGESFPGTGISGCKSSNKCVYTEAILSTWGE